MQGVRRRSLLFRREAGCFPTAGDGIWVKMASVQTESAELSPKSFTVFVLQIGGGSRTRLSRAQLPFYKRPPLPVPYAVRGL